MVYQGLTANIMSLGGIAVAIGAMVDASIIIIENVHKRLESWEAEGRPVSRDRGDRLRAMQEVGPSIFFSLLGDHGRRFCPCSRWKGPKGASFSPLALTKTYSMGFGAILAVTLTPALAALLIRGKIESEDANPLNRVLSRALRARRSLRGAASRLGRVRRARHRRPHGSRVPRALDASSCLP